MGEFADQYHHYSDLTLQERRDYDYLTRIGEDVSVQDRYNKIHGERRERSMDNRAERLRAQAAKLLEEASFWDEVPEQDPFEDGTVITFDKRWKRSYKYAAIRCGDGIWFTTGPDSPKCVSWSNLVGWLKKDVESIRVMIDSQTLSEWLETAAAEKAEEAAANSDGSPFPY